MANTIRINQLAKELNVPSKDILKKLRDEGLGEKAPNHQSAVNLGLAETIREWFHHHVGVPSAIETGTPVAAEAVEGVEGAEHHKAKSHKKKSEVEADTKTAETTVAEHHKPSVHRAKTDSETEHEYAASLARDAQTVAPTAEIPPVVVEKVAEQPAIAPTPVVAATPVAPETPVAAPVVETAGPATPVGAAGQPGIQAPPAVGATPVAAPVAGSAATTPTTSPVTAPTVPVATGGSVAAAPAGAPAAAAASGAVPAPAGAPTHAPGHAHTGPRPTVSLRSNVVKPHGPVKKVVGGRPPVFIPEPAKIQGPRVVRVEKEEVVNIGPVRRGPRPMLGAPTTTPAAPRGGRGVKVTTEEEDDEAQKKAKANKTLSARRRGGDGRHGEALEKLKEYTDADLLERQERLAAAAGYRSNFDSHIKTHEKVIQQKSQTIVQKGAPVELEEPITVRNLSLALGLKTGDIISKLMKRGVFATVNQTLDSDTAAIMALEWGIELLVKQKPSLAERLMTQFKERPVDEKNLVSRPAVVTILGHVDHGKTSLLDKIRNANVAAGEAGGITQHTAAWMVEVGEGDKKKRVTFIDTPGHQAFTAMRARGANMTDVVVLVVSAAEGVQPQTIESMNHARAAKVPIVVAMNKIDRADSNPDMVLGQLAKEGMNPVEWGGDTEVIRTSAQTGQGIPDLIEMLDYQSELLQLKTDPTAPVRGVVIEARMAEGLGAVATVLVQDGTLKPGDVLVCGGTFGKVRRMLNDRGEPMQKATASMPVLVSGLSALPNSGDKVFQIGSLDEARAICEERETHQRASDLAAKSTVSLDSIMESMRQQQVKEVRLIIKADVQGSVETLEKAVLESNTEEVKVRVIHAAAGPITESDVELADASKGVIIGFNVAPDDKARGMAEQRRVEVRLYRVIYEILDDLRKALSGMLAPEIREKFHGRAEIRQVFKVSKVGNIAGCMVTEGHIQRGSKIRLIRNGVVVVEDQTLESLRRLKDDAREVKQGFECGLKLAGYDDIKLGDVVEAYIRETIQRTL